MRREALVFTVFFLSAAALWLIAAAAVIAASRAGLCDYILAVRYAPKMASSALLSVPLSVIGGIILDLHLRGNT